MNSDDSTHKRSVQRSVARRRTTRLAKKRTGVRLQNNYPLYLTSKFIELATLLASELGGLTVGYGSDPPKKAHRIFVMAQKHWEKARLVGLRMTDSSTRARF